MKNAATVEREARSEFTLSPWLQAEFATTDEYVEYRLAEHEAWVLKNSESAVSIETDNH